MSVVACRSDCKRRFFGTKQHWPLDKESSITFGAYKGQDKLGLNYFDGLDDIASGIEDNGMHENLKRYLIPHHCKRLSKHDVKADRVYIPYQFAKFLLEVGGSQNWMFIVEESKIDTRFEMHVLKSRGKEREYKIGPK
ncbi:uncharacterized protein DS421_6g183110 [Arachis hypogaea]|nr:uncharacterized protein DS421_6g183110 [Arachis hypogaea]